MTFQESTAPLLRPRQVAEMKEEASRLQAQVDGPSYIRSRIQNIGEVVRQQKGIVRQLETQAPRPYEEKIKDAAVQRRDELAAKIVQGMPTQAEMRRAPPGALDKHRSWEKRNKDNILEYKNIQLRLHASGDATTRDIENDVANIEMLRPAGGSQELNLDVTQIPARQFHGLETANSVVMQDEDIEQLRAVDPELADMLPLLSAVERQVLKEKVVAVRRTISEVDGRDVQAISAISHAGLMDMCRILDLKVVGTKEELSQRILDRVAQLKSA